MNSLIFLRRQVTRPLRSSLLGRIRDEDSLYADSLAHSSKRRLVDDLYFRFEKKKSLPREYLTIFQIKLNEKDIVLPVSFEVKFA